jgi:hypothetical protein
MKISRYRGKAPDEIDWSLPEHQTRAVAEFLTAVDDEDGDADRKLPKVISPRARRGLRRPTSACSSATTSITSET